jgi:hypothetical protein
MKGSGKKEDAIPAQSEAIANMPKRDEVNAMQPSNAMKSSKAMPPSKLHKSHLPIKSF